MARGANGQAEEAELAVETVSRKPQQGRSKASLERMLNAARELMLERGSEDFTLQDVNQKGNVSIGSIYLRFQSKDNLVRAVIARALEDIAADEEAMVADVLAQSPTLDEFMPRYVAGYAEVLRVNAPGDGAGDLRPARIEARQGSRLARHPARHGRDAAVSRDVWRHGPRDQGQLGLQDRLRHDGTPAQPRLLGRSGA
jgi:AcrR family transcriptional regulator